MLKIIRDIIIIGDIMEFAELNKIYNNFQKQINDLWGLL